jgi:signal transduction histidine kinase
VGGSHTAGNGPVTGVGTSAGPVEFKKFAGSAEVLASTFRSAGHMDATSKEALAADSAELHEDLSARLSQKAAIAELGQRALLSADVDGLLQLAVDLLLEVLDVEYAKVLHQPASGEPLVMVAGSGWRDHVRLGETTVPADLTSQAGYTLLSHEPVIVDDLEKESRFTGPELLVEHGVVSGMSVIIQGRDRPYGLLGVHSARRRPFTVDDGDFLRSVANILGSAVENRRAIEKSEQSARYETALAECAQALLASSGEDRLQHALEALFVATEATYVFVERNVVDPELGFCSQWVAEAEDPNAASYEMESEFWDMVPWENMPTTRKNLERGLPVAIVPEELEGVEYEQYAADPFPIKSELEVPIFVDGEWAGLIGFSDQTIIREWSESDLSLLTTTAKMIGAFWEREAAQERLEQMNLAKDAFLASVSHELRTPLTAVVGFGQILQDSEGTLTPEERRELLDMVVTHGADLTNIISDLLVAARADIGELEVSSVPVNLRAQAAQVLESLANDQAAHIELIGHSVRAVADPSRVRQVIRNLVTNALRYGGEAIRVEVRSDSANAKVLVHDSGQAIPDQDRGRIFEPYQRAHEAPGLANSIGLGLAISRQLARLMGGDVTYRHEDGESIFEFTVPRRI